MALRAYKPGELFRRPMLARLNQKDREEESNISLEVGIDHSGEIVLVKGEGLDLKDSTRLKLSANSLPIRRLPIRPAEVVCQFDLSEK